VGRRQLPLGGAQLPRREGAGVDPHQQIIDQYPRNGATRVSGLDDAYQELLGRMERIERNYRVGLAATTYTIVGLEALFRDHPPRSGQVIALRYDNESGVATNLGTLPADSATIDDFRAYKDELIRQGISSLLESFELFVEDLCDATGRPDLDKAVRKSLYVQKELRNLWTHRGLALDERFFQKIGRPSASTTSLAFVGSDRAVRLGAAFPLEQADVRHLRARLAALAQELAATGHPDLPG